MSKFRPSSSLFFLSAGIGLCAISVNTHANEYKEKKSAVYKRLSKKMAPARNSLLFDQDFDKTPVRPLISDKLVKKIIEIEYAHKIAVSKEPVVVAKEEPIATQKEVAAPRKPASTPKEELESVVLSAEPVEEISAEKTPETKAVEEKLIAFVAKPKIVAKPKAVEAPEAQKPVEVAVAQEEAPAKVDPPKEPVIEVSQKMILPKDLLSKRATVAVVDEEKFSHGELFSVPEATIFWLHPNSSLSSEVDGSGLVKVPYPKAISTRFFVIAKGYLPAVGYAVKGQITPILLYKEKRLPPILKSLNIHPDSRESLLLGRFLDRNMKAVSNVEFESLDTQERRGFYSVGSFGLFHEAAKESGPQGDFLFKGLDHALQYLLASRKNDDHTINEWPAQILDLKGVGPVLTTTIIKAEAQSLDTQVVDAFTLIKPDSGIFASIGGQRGLVEPDKNGFLKFNDIYKRPTVDLIEINAQGYLKTWINTPVDRASMPELVQLFTPGQASAVLSLVGESVGRNDTLIAGTLRPEVYPNESQIWVFDSFGKKVKDAVVSYFGDDGRLSSKATSMSPGDARFMITGLEEGEFHLVLVDSATGSGQSIQVTRVSNGVVTQVQF